MPAEIASHRLGEYASFLDKDLANAEYRAARAWSMIRDQPPPNSLLDVGCGVGCLLSLAKAAGVRDVVGVEGPGGALDQARHQGHRVEQVDLDSQDLPFADSLFEVVTCLEVLEHLYNPAKVLREIARVLALDGRCIISVPNAYPIRTRLEVLFGKAISPPEVVGGHIKFFRPADIAAMCERSGLEVLRLQGVPYRTALRRYGLVIVTLLRVRPSLFATWLFVECRKA